MSIIIDHVSKSYGDKKKVLALDHISLEVKKGELFGLIGPDGAGKTSLFRILTTLILADRGTASVAGNDVVADYKTIRKIVGYMPGKFSLYQDLSIKENLDLFATIFDTSLQQNYDIIRDIYVHIEPFRDRRAGALSGGMKQKLALCCALIHQPQVLFLDEPTTGVDAVSRREFWQMLQGLRDRGITIFVSTPYMDEATLCDRIALIQAGRILSIDTPSQLVKKFQHDLWGIRTRDMYRALIDLQHNPHVTACYTFGAVHHALFDESLKPEDVEKFLLSKNHDKVSVEKIKPTVEDCFMDLMHSQS